MVLGLGQNLLEFAALLADVVLLPVPAVAQVPEAEAHTAATRHRLIEVKTLMETITHE